jgi:hypothetical protein
MNLVLKIAGGVFLGIMVAFAVIKAPDWIHQQRQKYADEVAAKKGFDMQLHFMGLTPDTVISACGKPDEDTSQDIPATPNSPLFTLRKLRFKALEMYFGVDQKFFEYGTWPDFDHPHGGDLLPVLDFLPCLKPK